MNWLLNRLLKWKGVPANHLLVDNLSKEQKELFTSEAQYIKETKCFKWFIEDMELMAERWMFSGNKENLLIGKGILYCIEVMNRNIIQMSTGKIQSDSQEKKKMRRFQ